MAQSKKCFEYSEKLTKYYSALCSYKIKRHLSSFFFLIGNGIRANIYWVLALCYILFCVFHVHFS